MTRMTHSFGYAQDDSDPQDDGDTAPLMDEVEVQVRRDCPVCNGSGEQPGASPVAQCRVCRAWWRREQARIGLAWTSFPCTHGARNRDLEWQPPDCERCDGDGHLYRWLSLGEWLDWLLSQIVFEDTSAVRDASDVHDLSRDVSRLTTARRRAV